MAALGEAIDGSIGRRPVGDVAAELDSLDARILDHLRGGQPQARASDGNAAARPSRGSGLADDALVYDPADHGAPR